MTGSLDLHVSVSDGKILIGKARGFNFLVCWPLLYPLTAGLIDGGDPRAVRHGITIIS